MFETLDSRDLVRENHRIWSGASVFIFDKCLGMYGVFQDGHVVRMVVMGKPGTILDLITGYPDPSASFGAVPFPRLISTGQPAFR